MHFNKTPNSEIKKLHVKISQTLELTLKKRATSIKLRCVIILVYSFSRVAKRTRR